MPAGHDFDALLMGSLYGELSAVEESRLQAHLAAHPSDHEILRSLLRTREAIRSSTALALVEPPQAISALLLQEAARRAPKAAASSTSAGGRLARWLAAFAAHPALAAATMAVVAVGAAGALYVRGWQSESHQTPAVVRSSEVAYYGAAEPSAAAGQAPAGAAVAAPEPATLEAGERKAKVASDQVADEFRVDLDKEAAARSRNAEEREQRIDGRARDAQKAPARPKPAVLKNESVPDSLSLERKPAPTDDARPSRRERADYVEATTSDLDIPLKEYDEEDRSDDERAKDAPRTAPPVVVTTGAANAGPSAGGDSVSAGKKSAPAGAARAGVAAPAQSPSSSSGAAASAPPPPPAPVSAPPAAAPSQARDKVDLVDAGAATDKWAKGEHARLLRLARANKCTEAAALARQISERAPRYYTDNVAADRDLRACAPAIRDAVNLRPDAKRKATRSADEQRK